MKRLAFFTILSVILTIGTNAQVNNRATIANITVNPGADPYLCVFGNTINDVTMLDSLLDLNGKEVMYLREKKETFPHQLFISEMERLNARFLSVHTYQRHLVETNGKVNIIGYFLVDIIERVGSRYYVIASNNY